MISGHGLHYRTPQKGGSHVKNCPKFFFSPWPVCRDDYAEMVLLMVQKSGEKTHLGCIKPAVNNENKLPNKQLVFSQDFWLPSTVCDRFPRLNNESSSYQISVSLAALVVGLCLTWVPWIDFWDGDFHPVEDFFKKRFKDTILRGFP